MKITPGTSSNVKICQISTQKLIITEKQLLRAFLSDVLQKKSTSFYFTRVIYVLVRLQKKTVQVKKSTVRVHAVHEYWTIFYEYVFFCDLTYVE